MDQRKSNPSRRAACGFVAVVCCLAIILTSCTVITSVNYSDLRFPETEPFEYALRYPSSDFHKFGLRDSNNEYGRLSASDVVLKATITNIQIEDNTVHYEPGVYSEATEFYSWIEYTITIDKVYYVQDGLSLHAGDSLTIRTVIFDDSNCMKDSTFQLQMDRQYILILLYSSHDNESPYGLSFDYPQIALTEDGGYLFFAMMSGTFYTDYGIQYSHNDWEELINEETRTVVMDHNERDGLKEVLEGNMFYRRDDQFEDDFQALCDAWCGQVSTDKE